MEEDKMPARYAFWRTPEGRPYRGTDGKHAPTNILAAIGRSVAVGAGKTTFVNLDRDYEIATASALYIGHEGQELSDWDVSQITWEALKAAAKKSGNNSPIRQSDFINEVNDLAAVYFRQPVMPYHIVTSLSVSALPRNRIVIRDCRVSAVPRKKKYVLSETLSHLVAHAHEEYAPPEHYLKIRIETKGRSFSEAIGKGFDSLNLLRGLWTLFGTRGSKTIYLGSLRCLAFCGQSNSLFSKEKEGPSDGPNEAQKVQDSPLLLRRV